MRKSTVYFFVVLTLLSLGLVLVPNAHSQTQNVKILNYSYYFDSAGFLDVVGEIQNVGPNTVNPVVLAGSVYSSDGTDQADSSSPAFVAYLAPQQKAPFDLVFLQPTKSSDQTWGSVDISRINLEVSMANATSSYQYPDLTITSNSHKIGTSGNYAGVYLVNGVIKNTGSQTATNLTVVAAFYNSSGTTIAVGYTDYLTPASLAPSKTLSFQIAAFDLNESQVPSGDIITGYSLLVQAQGPILQGSAPIVTSSPGTTSSSSTSSPSASTASSPSTGATNSPSASTTSSSSPIGVNSNNASNPLVIYVIVIVVAIVAVAGTILALNKRRPHETVKTMKKGKKAKKKTMVKISPLLF